MFAHDELDGVPGGLEATGAARVVDHGRFDPFGRRYGEDRGHDPGTHAGEEVAERGQRARGRVGEAGFYRVEGEEADGVFGYGTLEGDQRRGGRSEGKKVRTVTETRKDRK